nr:reverse transcriptase domain-containing protein [Tanacetum cinerariifolium]
MIQPEPEGSTLGYPLVSVEVLRSILTDSQVTPTKHGRMTKPYSSHRFIANCFIAGHLKMEVERRSVKVKELLEARPFSITQATEERIRVAIHPEYLEQTIAINSTLKEEGQKALCELLMRHLDIFSWKPKDMTGVPRHLAEYRLNVREGCLPDRQNKRSQAPEKNKAIQEKNLGSVPEPFSPLVDLNIKSPNVSSGTKIKEDPWLELQFSLVDNSKLNVVYLLNRSRNISFTSRRFTRRKKDFFMPKGIKQSPLEKVLLKSAEKYIRFSLKECTWLKFKFEGDNTPIVIQPPCYSGPSDVKESSVMDLKLCYNTFKFKEGESLTQTFTRYKALMNELVNDGIKLSKLKINTVFINGLPKKWLSFCQSIRNTNNVKDSELASLFGKLKYEENLIDSIYETEKNKSLVSATPLSTAFFSSSIVQDFQDSPDDEENTRSSHEYLNDLEEEYQARALLAKSKRFFKKEVSSDDNVMVEEKVLMALAEENDAINKEGFRNGEWVKISMRKVHTLLEMEDNDDRKFYLDYLCIDLNYVEEQRSNHLSKHRNLVHELNACKQQLLVLKQAKIDFLTMQHVNTKIFKENKSIRTKLKELKAITKTWLNSSNKVNQCISEQIPSQKKLILRVDQLTKDPSSSWLKDSLAEGFILPNHDTGRILTSESQRNTTNSSVVVTDSSATDIDSANESSVCSIPLPPLKKLDAPAKGNKSSSASKVHSSPAGKLKSVKIEDDHPLTIENLIKKANDGYLLGYSLVSKAFRVFNTRRKQTEETYHITFDESREAIKFSKPSVDNINIAESKRYPPDEYLHPYEPSQRYQTNSNHVSFIEPYECPEPAVLETKVSSDDEQIIDSLLNIEDIQISGHLSSSTTEDTSA